MKLSILFFVLAAATLSLGEEIDLENVKNYIKDGVIANEYLEALFKKVQDELAQTQENQENVRALKATSQDMENESEDTIRTTDNIDAFAHPTSNKVIKLSYWYDVYQNKFKDLFDRSFNFVRDRGYEGSFDDFYKSAKEVRVPYDFCPPKMWTDSNQACSLIDYKYRNVTGWCNNLHYPFGGNSNSPYARLLEPFYEKYCDTPRTTGKSGAYLPNPRDISLKLFRHVVTESITSGLFLFFGQFFDHDIVLTASSTEKGKINFNPNPNPFIPNCPCGTTDPNCVNIPVPPYDYAFPNIPCLPMVRDAAAVSKSDDCKYQCREQLTLTTQIFDLSSLYGWFEKSAQSVRANYGGLLKFTEYQNSIWPAFLNPKNSATGCCNIKRSEQCLLSGDPRTEDNAYLFSIQTLFFFEHNRIASEFYRRYPYCSDEIIFQETRRILIALFQKFIYNDWVPIALGSKLMKKFGLVPEQKGKYYYGYDDTKYPRVFNEFGLGMRFGHTMVKSEYFIADEYCNPIEQVNAAEIQFVGKSMVCDNMFDSYARSLVCDNSYYKFEQMNTQLSDQLFKDVFGPESSSLSARNVQRCREHGLRGYMDVREKYGLKTADYFEQLYNMLPETRKRLAELYAKPMDIDWWVGIAVERSFKNFDPDGGILPETVAYLVADQLSILKRHDRFFFESGHSSSNPFTQEQLNNIRDVNIGSLICQHVNIRQLQKNPFYMPSNDNPIISCEKFLNIDLDLWKLDKACTVY